jgi:putative transposase
VDRNRLRAPISDGSGTRRSSSSPAARSCISRPSSTCPRFVVGWALSAVNDRHLTIRALDMALKRRCPEAGLLHHSDQGCTYASEDYRTRLEQHGITCSMSRRGNCYDNAVMESWFSTVKSEEGERFESYAHAKEALFDSIEVFYNQRRRHSTLGQISSAEFERRGTHAA